jgi:hypothetical protein
MVLEVSGGAQTKARQACYPRLKMTAINILYYRGGGSQGIDLVQEMPDPLYWQATNDFGDDFEVL